MTMANCRRCTPTTRITSLNDGWVHLVEPEPDHKPEPPLNHAWHKAKKKKAAFEGVTA